MILSASAESFSSQSSPPPLFVTTEARFKAKLAILRDVAIGYVEGLQQASAEVISDITKCDDTSDLSLHAWYREVESDFYAVSHSQKDVADQEIWNEDLPQHLRLPAFFTRNCSKVVYCVIPLVREIIGGKLESGSI